jgi:hypothetical protein
MKTSIQEVLQEAVLRQHEISKMIQQDNVSSYVAIYASESGITLSRIPNGFHTRNAQISFANFDSKHFKSALNQVQTEIQNYRHFYNL